VKKASVFASLALTLALTLPTTSQARTPVVPKAAPTITSIQSASNKPGEVDTRKRASIYGKGLSGRLKVKLGNVEPKIINTRGKSDGYAEFIVPSYKESAVVSVTVINANGSSSAPYEVKVLVPEKKKETPRTASTTPPHKPILLPPNTSSKAALDGYLDAVRCDIMGGWAMSEENPNHSVALEVWARVNSKEWRKVMDATANVNRSDVGDHAFSFFTPASLKDGERYEVHVYGKTPEGTYKELKASPKPIRCPSQTVSEATASLFSANILDGARNVFDVLFR
jgi:hypothetical protein